MSKHGDGGKCPIEHVSPAGVSRRGINLSSVLWVICVIGQDVGQLREDLLGPMNCGIGRVPKGEAVVGGQGQAHSGALTRLTSQKDGPAVEPGQTVGDMQPHPRPRGGERQSLPGGERPDGLFSRHAFPGVVHGENILPGRLPEPYSDAAPGGGVL